MAPTGAPVDAGALAAGILSACNAVAEWARPKDGLRAPPAVAAMNPSIGFQAEKLREAAEDQLSDGRPEAALATALDALLFAAAHLAQPPLRQVREKVVITVDQAKEFFQGSGNLLGQAQATCTAAKLQVMRMRPQAGTSLAGEAADLFKQVASKRGQAQALAVMVDTHICRAATVGVAKGVRQSHMLKLTLKEVEEEHRRMRQKHLADGVSQAHEACDLFRMAKEKRGQGDLLCLIADMSMGCEDPEEGKEAAMMARDVYHDLDDIKCEQFALNLEIEAHIGSGDGSAALDVAKEIVKVFKKARDPKGEAEGLFAVMKAHFVMGDIGEMLAVAAEARELCQSTGNTRMEGMVVDALMKAHLAAEKPEEALQAAREAIGVYRKPGDKQGEAMALHTCANMILEKFFKETERNIKEYKKMGCLVQHYKEPDMPAYDEALGMLTRAADLFRALGDADGSAMVQEAIEKQTKRATMLNDPDETKQVVKDGRMVDVVHTWKPRAPGQEEAAPAITDDY